MGKKPLSVSTRVEVEFFFILQWFCCRGKMGNVLISLDSEPILECGIHPNYTKWLDTIQKRKGISSNISLKVISFVLTHKRLHIFFFEKNNHFYQLKEMEYDTKSYISRSYASFLDRIDSFPCDWYHQTTNLGGDDARQNELFVYSVRCLSYFIFIFFTDSKIN